MTLNNVAVTEEQKEEAESALAVAREIPASMFIISDDGSYVYDAAEQQGRSSFARAVAQESISKVVLSFEYGSGSASYTYEITYITDETGTTSQIVYTMKKETAKEVEGESQDLSDQLQQEYNFGSLQPGGEEILRQEALEALSYLMQHGEGRGEDTETATCILKSQSGETLLEISSGSETKIANVIKEELGLPFIDSGDVITTEGDDNPSDDGKTFTKTEIRDKTGTAKYIISSETHLVESSDDGTASYEGSGSIVTGDGQTLISYSQIQNENNWYDGVSTSYYSSEEKYTFDTVAIDNLPVKTNSVLTVESERIYDSNTEEETNTTSIVLDGEPVMIGELISQLVNVFGLDSVLDKLNSGFTYVLQQEFVYGPYSFSDPDEWQEEVRVESLKNTYSVGLRLNAGAADNMDELVEFLMSTFSSDIPQMGSLGSFEMHDDMEIVFAEPSFGSTKVSIMEDIRSENDITVVYKAHDGYLAGSYQFEVK